MRIRYSWFGAIIILVIGCSEQTLNIDPNDTEQVMRGKTTYDMNCARCHGAQLEGQPNWKKRNSDGKLPAPPHDETGHTWHHSNKLLFGIVKSGLVPPFAPPNYASDMPAFGSTLSDDEITAVLSYIESRWPPEIQKQHAEINRTARD